MFSEPIGAPQVADLAVGQPALAADRLGERALTVAVDAGDAEHLAEVQRQRDVLDARLGALAAGVRMLAARARPRRRRRVPRAAPLDADAAAPRLLRAGERRRRTSAARSRSRVRRRAAGLDLLAVDRAGQPALAQHRDAVAERDRLVQLVGDEDDRQPVLAQARRARSGAPRTACGVSIEVGSSRISTRDPRHSALMISTCCWRAEREVASARVGIDLARRASR